MTIITLASLLATLAVVFFYIFLQDVQAEHRAMAEEPIDMQVVDILDKKGNKLYTKIVTTYVDPKTGREFYEIHS